MTAAERWLFAPGSPRRLAALRIGLCGILAARLATGPYLELAGQPAALFRPVSFLAPLDAMPPAGVVRALQAVGLAAAVLALVGVAARVTLPLAWLSALPLGAMTSSLGKTAHNDVLLLLCLVPLLPAPTADAWSPRAGPAPPASGRHGWPVRTAMVVVAGAYWFSGLAKLLHAGPGWVTSDNLRWIMYASSDAQAAPNPVALFVADRPWLAHLLAAATLAVELGFVAVLARPRLAWLLVPAVVALHAGTWLALRLDYWAMAATVLVVFVDWPALVDRGRGRAGAGPPADRAAPGPVGSPAGRR